MVLMKNNSNFNKLFTTVLHCAQFKNSHDKMSLIAKGFHNKLT